jgi:hypothetical protein
MVLQYNPIDFAQLIFYFFFTIFFFTIGIYYFLKYPRYQNTFAKTFVLLIVVLICANGVKKSLRYSEELWANDEGAELITINAAHNFAEKGFTSNFGLPDLSEHYYVIAKNSSMISRVTSAETPDPYIYTHLPPGPWWIAGLFVKVCGNGTLSCPRILSTITSSLALLFFAIMIYSAFGPLKSTVLMFFVAIIPMTKNMVYTLHYHNYAFSIFLIYVGFLLYFFKKKRKLKIWTAIVLFILGFVQGWIAYEYVFLISLSPITFALLYSQLDKKEDRKRLFFTVMFPVIGFCSAIGLHFIQNSFYFGSIMEAFRDLFERGKTRLLSDKPAGWGRETGRISLSLEYFFVYARSWFFFIVNFPILLSVCLVLIWFKDINITIKKPINISLKWVSSRRNYFVILTAFLASFLWILTMFNQVANEGPHMARILFFSYFVCILTILECINSAIPNNQ